MSKKRKVEEIEVSASIMPPPPLSYLTGFSSHHTSEVLKGALPIGRNNPQKVTYLPSCLYKYIY